MSKLARLICTLVFGSIVLGLLAYILLRDKTITDPVQYRILGFFIALAAGLFTLFLVGRIRYKQDAVTGGPVPMGGVEATGGIAVFIIMFGLWMWVEPKKEPLLPPREPEREETPSGPKVIAADNTGNIFVIDRGTKDGVKKGDHVILSRGSHYIATIEITEVEADRSVGKRLAGTDRSPVMVGDDAVLGAG